ncbi:type VI secretion system-associated FHA domain protein TagH [Lysobacter yananisis]|uniref:Type VI secretion system-associated FHA domain protein TagH n=1 Tax=Lysobacter yananisis TaxID=1003114 RepID=A0ABY9P4Y2_9GAMM|nr:type VI secretion system-associated FHA domain protein TagH [Lysobacter yananisis]WMT02123.1 type VI secretion system-associated FHA domain protein TagH [Lysobacter yananisis]
MSASAQALTMRLRDSALAPAGARAQFEGGGSIGRGAACDWVLEADGVSRLHATVRCLDGLYFIEDHSTNGLLHNGAALQPGLPVALRHGDWLKIDVFEIDIAIGTDGAHAAAAQPAYAPMPAPVDDELPEVSIAVLSGAESDYVDEHDLQALLAGPRSAVAVDPLALLDRAEAGHGTEWSIGGWNHTPAAAAAYHMPMATVAAPAPAVLPENWDRTRTQYASAPVQEAAASAKRAPAAVAAGEGEGDTAPQPRRAAVDARPGLQTSEPAPAAIAIDEDFLAAAGPAVAPQRPEPNPLQALFDPPPSAAIAPVAFVGEFERPLDHPVEHPIEHPVDSTPNAPRPVPTGPQPPQHPAPASDAALFATAVAGLMDLLRARAEFKNGLRLPSTLVQRRENNPLKFAASVEEAIARLGGPTDGAYLAGEAAIEDAMRDIRHHQLALLAAMRIALEHAFAHFDPVRFDPDDGGKTALGWGGKGWRRYRERYQALRGDPDERYRVLFGDEFARAYEEQMSLMKTRDAGAHWSGTA